MSRDMRGLRVPCLTENCGGYLRPLHAKNGREIYRCSLPKCRCGFAATDRPWGTFAPRRTATASGWRCFDAQVPRPMIVSAPRA